MLSLELLAALLLDIVLEDGTPLKIQGLYGIDEDRFRQLPAQQLSSLWSSEQDWRLTVTSLLSVQPAF